jgi:hypothetical protein
VTNEPREEIRRQRLDERGGAIVGWHGGLATSALERVEDVRRDPLGPDDGAP